MTPNAGFYRHTRSKELVLQYVKQQHDKPCQYTDTNAGQASGEQQQNKNAMLPKAIRNPALLNGVTFNSRTASLSLNRLRPQPYAEEALLWNA